MRAAGEELQRAYYRATAHRYDDMHPEADAAHAVALAFMTSMLAPLGIESVLDVGSGTGRAVRHLRAARPDLRVLGVEPSAELRRQGCEGGLPPEALVDGDARRLAFGDGAFDLVCEFGVLHHLPDPHRAVSEMLRVASKAVFLSDSNNFGHGSLALRTLKHALDAARLWPLAVRLRTWGRGWALSEGDGVAYSYSVFSDHGRIARECRRVHLLGSEGRGRSLYRSAPTVALLGVK